MLYAVAGKTKEVHAEIPADGARVVLKANDVDGEGQRMLLDVDLDPADSLLREGGLTLAEPVTVILDPSGASREVTFAAGQVPAIVQIPLVLDGDIREWPFDRYDVSFVVAAFAGSADDSRALDTTDEDDRPASRAGACRTGRRRRPESTGARTRSAPLRCVAPATRWCSRRSCCGVLVALPVMACFVAARTYFGHRAVQPTLLSWMGAMLFAVIPLRNFLPGSPPAGSWVDAVIVLWVIVALVAALALYVLAWRQQS